MTTTNLTAQQIDDALFGGGKWAGSTITFSIPGANAVWDASYNTDGKSEPNGPGYSVFNASQAANFVASISAWDSYMATSFSQVADSSTVGQIRVAFTDISSRAPGAYAYAYGPPPTSGGTEVPLNGDIWVGSANVGDTFASGTFGYQALLHEIGHAIGLKHTFEAPVLPAPYESITYSIMSYTAQDLFYTFTSTGNGYQVSSTDTGLLTPMVTDIKAIQDLYGADANTATGSNVYAYTDASLNARQTIYDAGGIDTIDISALTRASMVDLRSGAYSNLDMYSVDQQATDQAARLGANKQDILNTLNSGSKPAYTWTNNVAIAFGVTIENVIGSNQADMIIGNTAANVIRAGGGVDTISGGGGLDIFRDTAVNLNGDTVTDFIDGDIVNVTDAAAAVTSLAYANNILSFAVGSTNVALTLQGYAGGTVNQRAGASGGYDIYFGAAPAAPSYSVAAGAASVVEGNTGAGNAVTFTVTRTDGTAASTVDVSFSGAATAPGGANADYAVSGLTGGKLSFAADATTATFTVTTAPDAVFEGNETVTATIGNPSAGGTITAATASTSITNDDAAPSFAISPANVALAEGNSGATTFAYTVTRTGDAQAAQTVNYVVTGSGANAADAADFTSGQLPSGTLSFAQGETSKTISIGVEGDTVVEPNEAFTLTLSNPSFGTITTAAATGTISNDDTGAPTPSYSIAAATNSVAEGNTGAGNAITYTVTRTLGTAAGSVGVAFSGSATSPTGAGLVTPGSEAPDSGLADYTVAGLTNGQLNFAVGATTATFTVTTAPDTIFEGNETVTATLRNPSGGGTIGTSAATATITNDDVVPTFAISPSNVTQAEGNSGTTNFTYTVTRTGDAQATQTVGYYVAGLGATPANALDYVGGLPSGTLSFAQGETVKTINIPVAGDTVVEPNERFTVLLSNPNFGTITTGTANGTITNDDAAAPANRAPVANADAITTLAHTVTTGNVLANDTDPDTGDTLAVTAVKFANGLSYAVRSGAATTVEANNGTLKIAADGSYTYFASVAGAEAFTYTVSDKAGASATSTLTASIGQAAPVQAEASFNFAFLTSTVAYVRGDAILTGSDGVARDVSRIGTLHFTDGDIVRADGSPLVDDLFYFAQYRDVYAAKVDADAHYALYGFKEGRDPDLYFSTKGYLDANLDVKAAGIDPLQHYDQFGWKEGRSPSCGFSAEAYLASNADVKAAGVDPLAHYLANGQFEERTIVPGEAVAANGRHLYGAFDADFYLSTYKDVAAASPKNFDPNSFAFTHYLQYGASEGRDPNGLFSTKAYAAANPDVGVNPLLHYELYGWHEGRSTSGFNTNAYLAANQDVAAAQIDPLQHYLQYGMAEGRPV